MVVVVVVVVVEQSVAQVQVGLFDLGDCVDTRPSRRRYPRQVLQVRHDHEEMSRQLPLDPSVVVHRLWEVVPIQETDPFESLM